MRMSERMRKAVSFLLALCMMLSVFPMPAVAEETHSTAAVSLKLRPVGEGGETVPGNLEGKLNGNHVVSTTPGTYTCYVGENTLSHWSVWPAGYLQPAHDITFTVDGEGNITHVDDSAVLDMEDGIFTIQVFLQSDLATDCDHALNISYEPNGDDTHKVWCTDCGTTVTAAQSCSGGTASCEEKAICSLCGNHYGESLPHSGGTATCTDPAHCQVCGTPYGELDPENHTGALSYVSNGNGTHNQEYDCCHGLGEIVGEPCSGGTATETQQARCQYCGEPYGDLLQPEPSCDHTLHVIYEPNGDDTHKVLCTDCGTTLAAAQGCSGGKATCQDPAHCQDCGAAYGELDPDHHTGAPSYVSNHNGTHDLQYTCCGGTGSVVGEPCYGGTPTEIQQARCERCGEYYGEKLPSSSGTIERSLSLKPLDPEGNVLPEGQDLDASLNGGDWVGSYYESTFDCKIGANVLDFNEKSLCPEGYALPGDIYFTVDSKGQITVISGNCTLEVVYGTTYFVITLRPASASCDHTGSSYTINAKAATCGAAGYTGDTMCECGETLVKGQVIPATGKHTDKTSDGDHICDVCNGENVSNHTGGKATCMTEAICTECAKGYGGKASENHTGNNQTVNKKSATCGAAGYTGDTQCECGKVLVKGQVIPATGKHTDKTSDGNHICDVCKADNITNHTGGKATCMAEAICTECAKGYGGKAPENHTGNNQTVNRKSATCGAAGYTGDTQCECGKVVAKGQVIPATGKHTDKSTDGDHICDICKAADVTDHTGGTATCMEGARCSDCKQSYGEKNPENHSAPTHDANAKAPTCVAEGYTGDQVCQCGVTLKRGQKIPATGEHTWGQWTVTKEPTYTTEGSRERSCSVCKKVETEAIPVGNHVLLPEIKGQVTADKETPETGEKVTITITPDVGKEVESVLVKDQKGQQIAVTKNENGTYSFLHPQGSAIVEVVLKDIRYTVTWTVDGKTHAQTQHTYGETILPPADPTKAQSGCVTYTFQSWNGFTAGMTMPDRTDLTFAAVFVTGENHDWTVTVQWQEDGSGCTMVRICGRDSRHSQTATAVVTSAVTLEATCTATGITTYTAVFAESWAETQTLELENIAPLGHSYGDTNCDRCGEKKPIATVPMYRMYDPNSGEHFYSGSELERDFLVTAGWHYEGVGFNFPAEGAPVHRLYDPVYGEHLYTMDEKEMNRLLDAGWNYEGVAFNSASSDQVPQYRLHNPNAKRGGYHFTGSEIERDILVSVGWIPQGIGWYSCWE